MKRTFPPWTRLACITILTSLVVAGCATERTETNSAKPIARGLAPGMTRVVSAERGVVARARFEPLTRSVDATSAEPTVGGSADCTTNNAPGREEIEEAPTPQAELDAVIATNKIIAERFAAAGIAFSRHTDQSGFEVFDYDHNDPDAWAAMEQAWLLISPPQPPTPAQLTQQGVNNDRLIADFDRAGIAYELVTDELGWAWLEWDFKDPETSEKYFRILDELYPPIPIEPSQECVVVESVLVP